MVRKKVMKKLTALLLSGIMAMTVLSGCGNTATDNDESVSSPENDTGSSEQANADGKETLVIAIQTYSNITDYDNNYLTHMLEDALDVNIEFQLLSADTAEAQTQISLMVSANQEDLPDIICTGGFSAETILEYGSKGVFVDLTDMINDPEITPNFHAIESEEDKASMLEASTSADGKIYSLVQFAPADWNMTPYRMFINQTWLDALNLPMPITTEEYYETLKAFAEQDPNGNGVKDEIPAYGFSAGTYGENITIPLMNYFIYYPAAKISSVCLTLDESGSKVIAPFTEDGWREGLEYMHRLCSEGLLPESVFTDDKTQFMAVLNNEEINLVGSVSTGSLSRWNDYDNNANGQQYELMPVLENPDGESYAPFLPYVPAPIWFVTSNCKNPELAVKLGDLFYRQDISISARYGEEGVDWTADPEVLNNESYSNAYLEAGLVEEKTIAVINDIWAANNNTIWRDMNPRYLSLDFANGSLQAKEYAPDVKSNYFYADNYDYYYDKHPEHLLPTLNYTNEEAQEQAEIITNISTYLGQSMAQFITGARPLNDTEWENYKEELNTMGLPVWLENAQAAFDRK